MTRNEYFKKFFNDHEKKMERPPETLLWGCVTETIKELEKPGLKSDVALAKQWGYHDKGDGQWVGEITGIQFCGFELKLFPDGSYFFEDTTGG